MKPVCPNKQAATSLSIQFLHFNPDPDHSSDHKQEGFHPRAVSHVYNALRSGNETGERTKSQHRLVDFAGCFLAQESRVVTLDRKQSHDA